MIMKNYNDLLVVAWRMILFYAQKKHFLLSVSFFNSRLLELYRGQIADLLKL